MKNMQIENVVIEYRDRPAGSKSKLNTYSDGMKVLRTVGRLFCVYHPLQFFGVLGILLAAVAVAFFIPIFLEYIETGLVLRFPTLFVCGFVMLAAIQSVFSGLVLQSMGQKNRQQFEIERIRCHQMLEENRLRK